MSPRIPIEPQDRLDMRIGGEQSLRARSAFRKQRDTAF